MRERLDKVLLDRGLVGSRERARALILEGKVTVNGVRVDKAGTMVAAGAEVALREEDHPYVSRGALKLVKALETWPELEPAGKVALDVGASTGGFTDVLLRRGARRVFAVDVGYGQLAWSLRSDPRVTVLERENIRHLEPARLDEAPELVVCDVSFISLTLVLPRLPALSAPGPRPVVTLIKPQFEAGPEGVGKGGVVRDPVVRQAAIDRVLDAARGLGYHVHGTVDSPIAGPAGNVECLAYLTTPA